MHNFAVNVCETEVPALDFGNEIWRTEDVVQRNNVAMAFGRDYGDIGAAD